MSGNGGKENTKALKMAVLKAKIRDVRTIIDLLDHNVDATYEYYVSTLSAFENHDPKSYEAKINQEIEMMNPKNEGGTNPIIYQEEVNAFVINSSKVKKAKAQVAELKNQNKELLKQYQDLKNNT